MSDAPEMVGRVKLALRSLEAAWLLDTNSVNPTGEAYEISKARAAIAAMREPTAAMVDAGEAVSESRMRSAPLTYAEIEVPWRAMIDEALRTV